MGVKKYSAGGGGVKNYSGALINLQGVGKLSVCVEKFSGRVEIFLGGKGSRFFQEGLRIFHKGLGFFWGRG